MNVPLIAFVHRHRLVAITLLVCLAFALPQSTTGCQTSESDYVVARSTAIQSDWSIAALVFQAGVGVLNGDSFGRDSSLHAAVGTASGIRTELSVDGVTQSGPTSPLAVWRLLGFVLWDADGRIERVTEGRYQGRFVRIVDALENGRVWVRVTVGPPLGDPRVRYAVLTLEANENGRFGDGPTTIDLSCSAVIGLPFYARRARVHARRQRWGCDRPTFSEGIAQREAGAETAATIQQLESVGREAVASGRDRLTAIVHEFLLRKCP